MSRLDGVKSKYEPGHGAFALGAYSNPDAYGVSLTLQARLNRIFSLYGEGSYFRDWETARYGHTVSGGILGEW